MKKSVWIWIIVIIVLALLIWLLFGNGLTGNAVVTYSDDGEEVVKSVSRIFRCVDDDASGGVEASLFVKSVAHKRLISNGYDFPKSDSCIGDSKGEGREEVKEAICSKSGSNFHKKYACPGESYCLEGRCVNP